MLATDDPALRAILGGTAGLIAGSFLATVALRWPAGGSAAQGRSRCDSCGATLGVPELVPVASWLVQRGRCRRCGARIDPRHVAIEMAAAGIGAAALAAAPGADGAAGAALGWTLLLLAVLDLDHFWLPDRLTLPLAAAGLAAAAVAPPDFATRLIGAAAGFAVLEAVRRFYAWWRGRAGLGGGDPKLFAAIGAWLGWAALPGVLLGASLAGLVAAAALRLGGRAVGAATRLPLGALLAPAGFVAWLLAAIQQGR